MARPSEIIAAFLEERECLRRHKSLLVCRAESAWADELAGDARSAGALVHFLSGDELTNGVERFANRVLRPALQTSKPAVVLYGGSIEELAAPVDASLLHTNLVKLESDLAREQVLQLMEECGYIASDAEALGLRPASEWYTPIERLLAKAMAKAGVYFRSQVPVGRFIADFLVVDQAHKPIVVECDGTAYHFASRDQSRDQELAAAGFQTIRFSSRDLFQDADGCVARLRARLATAQPAQVDLDRDLDPSQKEAVTSSAGPIRVLAPAGSGKTKVLVNRILFLVNSGVPQDRILALAFNKDAADQVQRRLAAAGFEHVRSRTFHSFGYEVLKDALGWRFDEAHRDTAKRQSDSYSSRVWCERELLEAKRQGLATLTVMLLKRGEQRSYPYGANGPTVVWTTGGDIASIALRAMIEWLRVRHFQLEAARILAGEVSDAIVLARPPELLDLAQGPLLQKEASIVLHPDPEVSAEERRVLREARPRMVTVTPSTLYRGLLQRDSKLPAAMLAGDKVAIALSDVPSDENIALGLGQQHLRDLIVHLARCLVSAGAAIAYGGDFRVNGYDSLFHQIIEAYNSTGNPSARYLQSYVEVTRDLKATPKELMFDWNLAAEHPQRLFDPPPGAPAEMDRLLALSDMRRLMALDCFARVAIGGQTMPKDASGKGYGGAYPGVVEEACWAFVHGKPLYVVGGFGGAAGIVAELLRGRVPDAMRPATFAENAGFTARAAAFEAHSGRSKIGGPASMSDLTGKMLGYGSDVLATDESALNWNGLTREENAVLFESTDHVTIARLVMKGLFKKARSRAVGKLHIELVRANIVQAQGVDAIAIATFEDAPMAGAGAALDKILSFRITQALNSGKSVIPIPTPEIDANWMIIANLGKSRDVKNLEAAVENAAREVGTIQRRYGFSRLAIVTLGGNVGTDEQLPSLVDRMVDGLRKSAGEFALQWFELKPDRFHVIKEHLAGRKADVSLSTRELPEPAKEPLQPTDTDMVVMVRRKDDRILTTLFAPTGSAALPEDSMPLGLRLFKQLTRPDAAAAPDDVGDLGELLGKAIFTPEGLAVLKQQKGHRLVIQHDIDSAALPFEALRIGKFHFATGSGIVRRPVLRNLRTAATSVRPPRSGALKVLLIANPTKDLRSAETEADRIEEILKSNANVVLAKVLRRDAATRASILESLRTDSIDVLHYTGHAFFARRGPANSGIVCAKKELLTLTALGNRAAPRIVFFNACQSGRVRAAGGPLPPVQEMSQSFAEHFLRAGVEAYLGTFWPVYDTAAAAFASDVYARLAEGLALDQAVLGARSALRKNKEPDWANYLLYGDGRFKLVTAR